MLPAPSRKRSDYGQSSDINVTPFVDILLVLLIVFMVAAPLVTTTLFVNNPPAADSVAPTPLVIVSLSESGELRVAREGGADLVCAWSGLADCMREVTGGDFEQRIFVRADQSVRYGEVVRLIDSIRGYGYTDVGIVSEETEA